jgi:hypothetical protein
MVKFWAQGARIGSLVYGGLFSSCFIKGLDSQYSANVEKLFDQKGVVECFQN